MTNLQEENTRMNWYLIESIKKWASDLNPILQDINRNRHWLALPYHTLMINRWLGSSVDDAARMAAIFKLFMLSDHAHQLVGDDDEGQVYDETLQFNILIGDLLYGSALCLLCEKGWDKLLPLFTEMIVRINEGHTMAVDNPQMDLIQLATHEWASYYRAAYQAAGMVNNLLTDQLERLDLIGLNLGLSVAAQDLQLGNDGVFLNNYLEGMDWLAASLNSNHDKRMEVWLPDTALKVPAAG